MRNGFSLLEALTGMAILSVLLLFVGIFSQSVFGVFGYMEGSKVISDTMSLVRLTLSSLDQCTLNFQNIPLTISPLQSSEIQSISGFDLKNRTPTSLIVKQGQNTNGVLVQNIQMTPLQVIDTGLVYGELQFTFKLPGSSTLKPSRRVLPMMVRIVQGKVSNCWVKSERASQVADQVCAQVSAEGLNMYNKDTGSCELSGAKWFSGSPQSATCPAGTFLSPNANADANCGIFMPPSYVDNTDTSVVVQYSDGTSDEKNRMPAFMSINLATSTCTCNWATDISPANIATFKCQILCLAP